MEYVWNEFLKIKGMSTDQLEELVLENTLDQQMAANILRPGMEEKWLRSKSRGEDHFNKSMKDVQVMIEEMLKSGSMTLTNM